MSRILKHLIKNSQESLQIQVRYSRTRAFIPVLKRKYEPVLYYSLEERLNEEDEKLKDPSLYEKVNIGFSTAEKISKRNVERWKRLQDLKQNFKLEKAARNCTLKLDLETVERDWIASTKPTQIKSLAENAQIYNHLFGDYAFFYPIVNMEILYDFDDDTVSPVYAGNLLKPKETSTPPSVKFESDPDSLWTLVMTNPDGNLYENESEMLHWLVGNIPGGDVSLGEEAVSYLRPIPPKGTGFHRLCFLLYKQEGRIDFEDYRREGPCLQLESRTFKTFDFYKRFEGVLTPAGLAWFNADYDSSLKHFFHSTLKMKEPMYEYAFPEPYIKPQRFFPHLRPFNRYLDLHRDPKEMQKLMLLKRLSRADPLRGDTPLLPFPGGIPIAPHLPVWMKNEIAYERDGKGKYRDAYRGDDRPAITEGKIKFPPMTNFT